MAGCSEHLEYAEMLSFFLEKEKEWDGWALGTFTFGAPGSVS